MASNLNFKLLRLKAGLRQIDIARKMNISENSVTKWETGRGSPGIELQAKLAEVLGCSKVDVDRAFEGANTGKMMIKKI